MIKPILFNTEMVRAILDGRKTVTRRLVKPKYREGEAGFRIITNRHTGEFVRVEMYDEHESESRWLSPPYQVGDILYVRESFVQAASHIFWYKADGKDFLKECKKWKPSIHMPKEAARIWLKVTDVRVERLQDMTANDIRKEGLTSMAVHCGDMEIAQEEFGLLWNSTIKKQDLDQYGWKVNPWVWVIEFERCERPEE